MNLLGLADASVMASLIGQAADAVSAAAAAVAPREAPFNFLDWAVIAVFIISMVGVVVWASLKKNESGADYFLAGRDANWLQIGSSIFSSNIGSEHLVGLAGAGFITGMAMAHWEMHAWLILVLGWVFVPLYDRMKVFTMPEFLEKRFSPGSRSILSFLTMASLVLTKIAATIYAGDVVIRTLLDVETVSFFGAQVDVFWVIALGLAFTTGVYTVLGGMRVIMYTAVLQTPVLLFGSACILYMGLQLLGHGSLVDGWHATVDAVGKNVHLIRSNADPDWPWLAVLPGSAIIGFWYWCTDQYIVQRVLAGKNQQESRRGSIFAGYLKLTPVFIFLVPGMIAFALTQQPGATFHTSGDAAYTSMVAQILPHGIKGLVACGMLVALMASLASKFNASATLFTMDFYLKWKPQAPGREVVTVGRVATAVIVLMGICWVLVMKSMKWNLYEYLQNVQAYMSPAIAVLFAVGVFWKRATAPAAFWAFLVGAIAGFARLATDLIMRVDGQIVKEAKQLLYQEKITALEYADRIAPVKAKFGLLFEFWNLHWLYFCQGLFVLTVLLMVVISLFTRAPDPGTIKYTWYGATPEERLATRASWSIFDVVNTLVVAGCVVAFYCCFW